MRNLSAYELSIYGANVYQSSAYGPLAQTVVTAPDFMNGRINHWTYEDDNRDFEDQIGSTTITLNDAPITAEQFDIGGFGRSVGVDYNVHGYGASTPLSLDFATTDYTLVVCALVLAPVSDGEMWCVINSSTGREILAFRSELSSNDRVIAYGWRDAGGLPRADALIDMSGFDVTGEHLIYAVRWEAATRKVRGSVISLAGVAVHTNESISVPAGEMTGNQMRIARAVGGTAFYADTRIYSRYLTNADLEALAVS